VKWLGIIFKSMGRARLRTLLILGTMTFGVLVVAILQSMLTTLDSVANNPNSSNRAVVRHKSGLAQLLPASYIEYLKQQPEIESICRLQWFGGFYQDPKNFFANFASDPETLFTIFREEFGTSGITEEQIKSYQRDRNGCIVGETLANKFGWKVGDTIPLTGTIFPISPRLTIRVIFKSPKTSDENVLHFHFKLLEEGIPRLKGRVGSYWLRVKSPDDIPRLSERVDRNFANSAAETLTESENAFNLSFVKMLGNLNVLLQGISAVVLVALMFVAFSTMAMAIRERTTEISVLRALGFTEGRVLSLVLAEGMVLSGLGGALGLGLTWFVAFGVRAAMGDIFPWFQDFALAPRTILICGGGAVLVGLLSSFLPAYQAVRRPIVEGLRTL
jgi:putative ABC transport system permease protein